MTSEQRLHREKDPRVTRSLGWTTGCVTGLGLAALLVVGVRVQAVHLGYRLDAIRAERAKTETLIRQLEVQVATLRSPRRVESQARQLGLAPPGPQQVQAAREFVSGSGGLSASRAARIEAQVR
jgi:cell division protein FtsL